MNLLLATSSRVHLTLQVLLIIKVIQNKKAIIAFALMAFLF